MSYSLKFDLDILNSVAGGRSAIYIPRLNIHTIEEAKSFISCYGFDLSKPESVESLWYFHRRALILITEKLGFPVADIPEVIKNPKVLYDISRLLVFASSRDPQQKELQRWACAFLRCMHVFVHAENDLFASFSQEIQKQILEPYQHAIINDGSRHRIFLKSKKQKQTVEIDLAGFEVKPFKTSSSTVIKLLARPDALAMKIFDKLGVRFVTRSLFDSFQVIRFLVDENIMSFPHIMPDQSSNNLYPVKLFVQTCEELTQTQKTFTDEEVYKKFEEAYKQVSDKVDFQDQLFRKPNEQSDSDFRFIKFITRQLITVNTVGHKPFTFFYPYEVQIMDEQSHQQASSGPLEHQAYKERQKMAARERILPKVKE